MNNEYSKIKSSLEIFAELSIVYNSCDFRGISAWCEDAEKQVKEIQNLNIDKKYFKISLSEAENNLRKKLIVNKSKNIVRNFKSIEKALLKYELKSLPK